MPAFLERPIISSDKLGEIRARFAISETELATMFAVSRPSIAKWRVHGVPAERYADVDRVLELARYFHRNVKPQRVAQLVRTPGNGLGGLTVLETIASHGALPIFEYLERLLSYVPQ